ncbi:N-acetyl-gamma-glutamyl-phosphate reductase [Marinoscillum sp. MHG1-6]|uniref:N-acetyl-gamma-glutamyl-phosphate reductase n=1 Tax=Marinoscillum sp. MHG1-6 TaxID=2959627 RepID=UPI00215871BF|nr:N-acetyl-gamma-glutamyl-phosphate reductase [Marinoscillum sp. MHG1-6]
MIRAGIVGAAGYTAGELFRILVNHPKVEITQAQSESQAGKPVTTTHSDLVGDTDLTFDGGLDYDKVDVIFLCKGHGESVRFLEANPAPASVKVVDLSHDYRLKRDGNDFVYGLPEINKALIMDAQKVANPGCFATCIQLGLLPAAQAGYIESDVHVSGITGSTGAGQSLSSTSHFSWRNNNMSVYKAFTHQHLGEIGQSLNQVSGKDFDISFIPYRGNFTRGIIVTSYFDSKVPLKEALEKYKSFYLDEPFVHLVDENPDIKQVVNSNKALIYLQKHNDKLMVISLIDNLLKGASGQAVQNMNLMFGLEEEEGLKLKSVAF